MFCSRCNASMPSEAAFCPACGTPVSAAFGGSRFQAPPPVPPLRLSPDASPSFAATAPRRPLLITLLAVIQFLGGGLTLIGAIFGVIGLLGGDAPDRVVALAFCIVLGVIGVLSVLTGYGLWALKPFGRSLQLVLAVIGLLAIPLGTVVSLLILIYLNKPGVKLLFGEKPRETWTDTDHAAVSGLYQRSSAVVIIAAVVGILVLVSVAGIVAAIALPALLRARMSANEASAIGTVRMLQVAELTYASQNGGAYGSLECLTAPSVCLAAAPNAPFASADVLASERAGYTFEFYPGTPADPAAKPGASLQTFAFVAIPATPGSTGVRSFCTDSTGLVCHRQNGVLSVTSGMCPASCEPLDGQPRP